MTSIPRAHPSQRKNSPDTPGRISGAESLWSTFKHEYYYRHTFVTAAELIAAIDKWMIFYNTQRRHSTIGMLSPIAYEQSLNTATQAA